MGTIANRLTDLATLKKMREALIALTMNPNEVAKNTAQGQIPIIDRRILELTSGSVK